MLVEAKVKLTVETVKKSVAQAIYHALKPDNWGFPDGLSMMMKVEGERLTLYLSSRDKMETLISTIDEILEHIQMSLETLEKAV